MKTLVLKFKRFLRKAKAYLPSPLPSGMTEFDAWSDEVLDLYGAPNNDSTKFALATMILHAGPQDSHKPMHYFGRTMRKSMANQVAAGVMQELKAKQEAARLAATADVAKPEVL